MTQATYSDKTFHMKFEDSYGYLKPEQLPPLDYSEKCQIEKLFPSYKRVQLEAAANKIKLSKVVDIPVFSLRTPDNTDDLFLNARLEIEPHKRCALFGINGSGKTSLFNAISSNELRNWPPHLHVHHMKELEHHDEADALSVLDTVLCSHPYHRILNVVDTILKNQIEAETDPERLAKLKENLEYIDQQMSSTGAYQAEKRAKSMLRVLGFDETGEAAPISSLSGGLRMRVALACAFIIDPDVLLLDEPTNHLDMPSVLWLEQRLRAYKGSYLLVTHDRTLLENVVTSVMLIQDMSLHYYACGFKDFEKQKEKDDQERAKRIDTFLNRNRNLPPDDPQYRTKMTYQAWIQKRYDRQMMLQGKFTFKAPEPLPCDPGQEQNDVSLIKVEGVRFTYNAEKGLPFIFHDPISYNVKIGTRVGIMGPNGAGKSTFLKLITKKLQPTAGTIACNPNFVLAYFGQHLTKELQLDMTPIEFMCSAFPDSMPGELKAHLRKTSISDDPMNTRMSGLSFSQRSCVIFAKLTYIPPHLLIMDEPTNFLDLDSVDSLIMAVNKFSGGLIVVTHNRDFLKRCSRHFLSIVPGAFLEFETMKAAERATYSFITALEEGQAIDHKQAIMQNRGGGALHTKEEQAIRASRLNEQQRLAQEKADAVAAEAVRAAALAADKEARRQAKLSIQKTDWVAGEICWAPVGGKHVEAKVIRNIPSMGVTVQQLSSGKTIMLEAKKLKVDNPGAPEKTAPKAAPQGQQGSSSRGGRHGARGGAAPRGGSKGGRGGTRGGARGGVR